MTTPILLYERETWIPTIMDLNKIQSGEIEFSINNNGCLILDKIKVEIKNNYELNQ